MTDEAGETVQLIAPSLTPAESVEQLAQADDVDPESVRFLGYPKYLFEQEIRLERLFMSDRHEELVVTVDAVTGGGTRSGVFPELERRTLSNEGLLQPRFGCDEAEEKSRSVTRRYISIHFPTAAIVTDGPSISLSRESFAFHPYWLVPTGTRPGGPVLVTVVDAVSGKVLREDLDPSSITPEQFV